jgi:phosphoserine phosphatase RsbU/P
VTPVGSTGDKPLGLDENATFREFRYEVDPGDGVVLYTDGVIEALTRGNERYGYDRLVGAIRKAPAGADALVRGVIADVRAFAAGSPQSDDLTVVCFTRK